MVVRMQPAQLFIHASSLATSHFPFPISASHTRSCYTDLRCNTFTPEFSHQHVQRQRAPTDARRNPPGRSRACVRRQRRPPKNPHCPSRRQPLHGCRHPPLPFLRKPRIRPRHTLPKSASGFLLTRRRSPITDLPQPTSMEPTVPHFTWHSPTAPIPASLPLTSHTSIARPLPFFPSATSATTPKNENNSGLLSNLR